MRLTAGDILQACHSLNGRLVGGSLAAVLSGVATDSRTINRGELFVPLAGEKFDGHDFIDRALERGAGGLVVRSGFGLAMDSAPDGPVIVEVADTLAALGLIARWWRLRHSIPVAAVSGSMGKTSTKEMLAAILGAKRRVLKTEGNFNNLIGLPLTLFRLEAGVEAAVLELGISVPGEMARLADIARPQVGLLTNIAPVHLAGLGDITGVAHEKTELWRRMGPAGTAVVNLNDPYLVEAARSFAGRKVTFGRAPNAEGADVRLMDIEPKGLDGQWLDLIVAGERDRLFLPAVGYFYGLNAAAACAAAYAMGAGLDDMVAGLRRFSQPDHRMKPIKTAAGVTVIDDTYNANPQSMLAVMETIVGLKPNGNRVGAILGQMAELGQAAEAAHVRLGREAGRLGLDPVIALGPLAELVIEGARQSGVKMAIRAEDPAEAVHEAERILAAGDWVLVKGSRAAGLEKAVELLTGEHGGA